MRIVFVIHGTQIIASNKKIDIDILSGVSGGKCREWLVGELFFPVQTIDSTSRSVIIKLLDDVVNFKIVKFRNEWDG